MLLLKEAGDWQMEEGRSKDLFKWIFRILPDGQRQYLAGTSGRIEIALAKEILPLLNSGEKEFRENANDETVRI